MRNRFQAFAFKWVNLHCYNADPTDITILAFEEGPNGLQVLPDGCAEWVDVAHVPGALLVNLGDIMRFWTNDTWRSTRHRVVLQRRGGDDDDGGDRLSLVFFHMVGLAVQVANIQVESS
jgi:isopenicillin N synthase-like dioxygenase